MSRGCQSCGEKVKVGSEAGFMIFFHVALRLRQKESAADTSLRIQNKYSAVHANAVKLLNLAGLLLRINQIFKPFFG